MKLLLIAIVYLIQLYFLIGIIFSILFVSFGVQRIDHAAKEASVMTRLFLFPGSVAFWPFLLLRWIKSKKQSHD